MPEPDMLQVFDEEVVRVMQRQMDVDLAIIRLEDPPYQCPGCGRGYSSTWGIRRHLLRTGHDLPWNLLVQREAIALCQVGMSSATS